jgi:hypothetical protein
MALLTIGLPAAAQEVAEVGSRRELFVNHWLIDRMDRVALRLHQPQAANTVLQLEKPWEGYHNFGVGVFYHEGRYYFYYRAMPGERFGKYYAAVATSSDGIDWSRPNLGLVEVHGTTENNVVALEDENGQLRPVTEGLDFWLDTNPRLPQSERFKLVTYHTNGGPHNPGPISGENAVHTATFWVSADGFRFRKKDPQPRFSSSLKNSFDGVAVYFWSEAEQQYVCYFRWYDRVRTIARATSKDLMTWSDPVPMTYGNTPRENLYENMTTPYFRAPHLYVALATRFMEGRTGILTEEQFKQLKISDFYKERASVFNGHPADGVLMTSRAGSTEYDRTFMESFVRPGIGLENWVNRGNYLVSGIFQTGPAEMSIYVMRHYMQPSWHIERLTLRLDGFASVHAPYAGGEMITRPFTFDGKMLTINYATSAAGDIRVEIQDAEGQAIPGFTLNDADSIVGDEISRVVTWGGKSDVGPLAGKPVRLRFLMRDADLYSVQFAPSGTVDQ